MLSAECLGVLLTRVLNFFNHLIIHNYESKNLKFRLCAYCAVQF